MTKANFDDIVAALGEVQDHLNGRHTGAITHVPPSIDVRAVRRKTKRTQAAFASHYGFTVAAVRDWEQGRRQPERPTRLLLAMIDRAPELVEQTLAELNR